MTKVEQLQKEISECYLAGLNGDFVKGNKVHEKISLLVKLGYKGEERDECPTCD